MGLDMFAYKAKNFTPSTPIDFRSSDEGEEFFYWRKHPNLHGLMERIYREKGGEDEFNCVNVSLTSEDLDSIEKAVNENALPETSGFFFGQSYDEDKVRDLEFIKAAREALAEGFTIWYSSWW
jgi:hypothetical protein